MRSDTRVPDSEEFRFRCEEEVRFRDLDAMGHVNNAVYVTYFEVVRARYMSALGHVTPGAAPLGELFPFVLADLSCRFLSPVGLGERLLLHVRADELGRSSFVFEYLVTSADNGRPIASGRSTQVYYDHAAGRSAPIPEGFRERLEALEGRRMLPLRRP